MSSPIVVEQLLNAPIDIVWKAITAKDEMKKWYFELPEFKAEKGFQFQFYGGENPENQFLHVCEVTEVIPGKKYTFSWRYDGYAGNSFVTFDLSEQGKQTLLKLTHTGIETFPDLPDFARTNFESGWNYIVSISLKKYL